MIVDIRLLFLTVDCVSDRKGGPARRLPACARSASYFGISRQLYYTWLRRYQAEGATTMSSSRWDPDRRSATSAVNVNLCDVPW
jgi:hypothetical protein